MIDMGNRFRLLVNEVSAIAPEQPLPAAGGACVVETPRYEYRLRWMDTGRWAHHTVYSQNLTTEYLEDFAEMAGIEMIRIGTGTTLTQLKNELRWNETSYR